MSWLKIDDRLWSHRKIVEVGDRALGVWLRLACWSAQHEEDGRIPRGILVMLTGSERSDQVQALLEAGMLDEGDQGSVFVHDFLKYNPSRSDLEAKREVDRERKRHGFRRESQRIPSGNEAESAGTPGECVARKPGRDGTGRDGMGFPVLEGGAGGGRVSAHLLVPWEAFCEAYPDGRLRRADAEAEFARINPDSETAARIVAGVRAWAASDEWRRGMVPWAATFLRSGQWADPPPKPADRGTATGKQSRTVAAFAKLAREEADGT